MAANSFEANRNAVLGIKSGSTTPTTTGASSSFLQNRATVLSSPAPKVNLNTPTSTPTQTSTSNVFNNISNTIKSWFTPTKIEPIKPIDNQLKAPQTTITNIAGKQVIPKINITGPNLNGDSQKQKQFNLISSVGESLKEGFPQVAETINSLITDPLSTKANYKNIFTDVIKSFKEPVANYLNTMNRRIDKNAPKSEYIAQVADITSKTANVVLSPINALFNGLNDVPVVSSFVKLISIPFLTVGEAAPITSNLIIDQLPISDKDKENLKPAVGEVFSLAAQIALGKVMEAPTKKLTETIKKVGVDNFEKLTKNMIEESGSPKTIKLTADQMKEINLRSESAFGAEDIKSLGLSGQEWKNAITNGLSVEIPAEKIVRVMDKPYWSKIKGIFGQASTDKIITTPGQQGQITGFGGYLTEKAGQVVKFTPEEALTKVTESNIQNTPEGQLIISKANEARIKNQSVEIKVSDNPDASIKSADGNIEVNVVDTNPVKLTPEEKKITIVYTGQPVGGKVGKQQFFTTDENVAKKYAEVNKNVTGESEVVSKDISNLKFKEVSQKEMLDAIENPKIIAKYDGVVFKNSNTGDINYAVFNKSKSVKPVKVYRGTNGKVLVSKRKYQKVLEVKTNQSELIKKLADEGNVKAQKLYESMPNKDKVDFTIADPIIKEAYGKSYDAIKYQNDTPQLKLQGTTYYDLKNGRSYAENKSTAKLYSMQNRSGKYEVPEKKVINKARAEVAESLRNMYSDAELKTIATIKRLKNIKKYAEGDIETFRKTIGAKIDDLIETVKRINNDMEMNSSDALELALEVPTLRETRASSYGFKPNEQLGFNPKNLADPKSPKAEVELKKIVKQSEIAKNLSEKLNVPIRRGKFRLPGAIGVYKTGQKVVRIKSGGLNTIFHEVAHFLDDTLSLSGDLNITERKALLVEYGNGHPFQGQPVKQRKEGFAEYMRFKLTGQQEKIDAMSPEFDKLFEKEINKYPEVKEVLDIAREDYKRWQEQPAIAKILSQISIGPENKGSLKDRVVNKVHDLYTIALDDLHPLSEFVKVGEKAIGEIPAEENPYILARNSRGWVGKADLFLNKGTFDKNYWTKTKLKNGKYKFTIDYKTKGYKEIMKPIESKGLLDEFRVYIVAKRIVVDFAGDRKIKTGIAIDDAKEAVKQLEEKYPEFIKVGEERLAYKDQLLKYGAENGLIGPKGLAKIKELNKYHVPFYRVMEETTGKFLGKKKLAGNIASPIKKIKGSEREIIDPLESDVKDTYAIINAAERNNIGIAMANLAAKNFELGRLFEKVDKPMTPVKVNAKEVLDKILKQQSGETIEMPEELANLAVTLFRPGQISGPNMLSVNFGDKQFAYQVDPDLFKSIQGLNAEDLGMIIRILSIPAKLLRSGATLTPDFSVRNPIRDQFSALVYSKYNFVPGVDLVKGIFELFKAGDVYDLWKAGGGENSMLVSMDRDILQKSFKQIMQSKGAAALEYVKNPLKALQLISELGEEGTRLGEMRQALRAGDNPIAGAFAAREITLDFPRIGAKTKAFNSITAFFNANLQGTDKMIRSFKTKPFKTLFKTMVGITLPSILLYLANRDDPRWKEIPAWQKDLFWIIMTKDHIYRIPKPFELGVIFGSVPERILEVIDTKNPKKFDELKSAIISGFTPGFLPTGLIPIIENITNYSFFLDRPIVSQGQQNLPPEAQKGTYTSEVATLIGETLKYSPSKIDNLIQGYTGGLGKYTTSILDKVLEGTGIATPDVAPAANFEDTPVLKAFMIRNPVGTSSESVNQVYNLYGKVTPEINYVKKLVKLGETDKAKLYIKNHPEVAQAPLVNAVVDSFSEINKTIDQVRRSKELDAVQKRDKINQLGQLETTIAQKLLKSLETFNE